MTTADGKAPGGGGTDEEPLDPGQDPAGPASEPWDEAPLETEQLAFDDEDVRLPWLEGDGEDDEDYRGRSAGQLIVLLAFGLLALAVIGGGIWWAIGHRKDEVLVADGSVVPAPRQPYKERPQDPGGKTFAGTGDTSFAVSEGQTRPARLGESPAAKPATPEPSAEATPAAPAPSGVGVQVAAYSSRASAEAGWTRLSGQYEALSGLHHRVVEGSADIGTVYRLQALAPDAGAAHALCTRLKAAGLACQVKN